MFDFKEFAKSLGWTVPRSSDGATYNSSGDQITTGGGGAGGMANNNAWFELRCPGGLRSLMIQRTTGNTLWRIKYSAAGAGFTGGTPTATRTPTATDEAVVRGGGTDAAPTGYALHAGDGTYGAFFTGDDEPESDNLGAGYYLSMGTRLTASDFARTNFTIEPMHETSYPECDSRTAPTTGDADPVVLTIGHTAGSSFAWSLSDNNGAGGASPITNSPVFGWYKYGYVGATFLNFATARPVTNATNGYTLSTRAELNPYDGLDELFPIPVGRSNDHTVSQRGFKGHLAYSRQRGNVREWPSTIDTGGTDTNYVAVGRGAGNNNHYSIPWEVGLTPTGTVASTSSAGRDLAPSYVVPPVPVDPVPPVVSVISKSTIGSGNGILRNRFVDAAPP